MSWLQTVYPEFFANQELYDDDLVSSLERKQRKHADRADTQRFFAGLGLVLFTFTAFIFCCELQTLMVTPENALTGRFFAELAKAVAAFFRLLWQAYQQLGDLAWTLNAVVHGPDFEKKGITPQEGASSLLSTAFFRLALFDTVCLVAISLVHSSSHHASPLNFYSTTTLVKATIAQHTPAGVFWLVVPRMGTTPSKVMLMGMVTLMCMLGLATRYSKVLCKRPPASSSLNNGKTGVQYIRFWWLGHGSRNSKAPAISKKKETGKRQQGANMHSRVVRATLPNTSANNTTQGPSATGNTQGSTAASTAVNPVAPAPRITTVSKTSSSSKVAARQTASSYTGTSTTSSSSRRIHSEGMLQPPISATLHPLSRTTNTGSKSAGGASLQLVSSELPAATKGIVKNAVMAASATPPIGPAGPDPSSVTATAAYYFNRTGGFNSASAISHPTAMTTSATDSTAAKPQASKASKAGPVATAAASAAAILAKANANTAAGASTTSTVTVKPTSSSIPSGNHSNATGPVVTRRSITVTPTAPPPLPPPPPPPAKAKSSVAPWASITAAWSRAAASKQNPATAVAATLPTKSVPPLPDASSNVPVPSSPSPPSGASTPRNTTSRTAVLAASSTLSPSAKPFVPSNLGAAASTISVATAPNSAGTSRSQTPTPGVHVTMSGQPYMAPTAAAALYPNNSCAAALRQSQQHLQTATATYIGNLIAYKYASGDLDLTTTSAGYTPTGFVPAVPQPDLDNFSFFSIPPPTFSVAPGSQAPSAGHATSAPLLPAASTDLGAGWSDAPSAEDTVLPLLGAHVHSTSENQAAASANDYLLGSAATALNVLGFIETDDTAGSGLGSIAGSQSDLSDMADGNLCTICWVRPRQVGFLHGKTSHLCVCRACASQLREGINRCPMCRQLIERIIDIY